MRFMAFSVVCLLVLSGCDHYVNQQRQAADLFEGDRRSYEVKPTVSSISLQVEDKGGLSAASLKGLNTLLRNQGRLSNQVIRIQPITEKGEPFSQRLEATLLGLGVPQNNVSVQPLVYREGTEKWDVTVTSEAIVVMTPDCSIADNNLWMVKPYEAVGTLGCANRANIAKMVANPRDLMRPNHLEAADGVTAVGAVTRFHEAETKELLDIDFNED